MPSSPNFQRAEELFKCMCALLLIMDKETQAKKGAHAFLATINPMVFLAGNIKNLKSVSNQ